MVQLVTSPLRFTSSMTMRSVAMRPEISQKDWVSAVSPVDQMKMGMKSTVTMARIRRLAKIGERALRSRLICIILHRPHRVVVYAAIRFSPLLSKKEGKAGLWCFEPSGHELVACLTNEGHRIRLTGCHCVYKCGRYVHKVSICWQRFVEACIYIHSVT